jgi:hypothetical protein
VIHLINVYVVRLCSEYRASRERWLKNKLAEEGGLCIDCVRSCDKGVEVECRKKHEVQ